MVSMRCRESFFWQFTLVNVIILLYPVETTELGSKYRRQAVEGVSNVCKPFVNVSNNQFFSPGYPADTYPNNTDCIVILEAPPGHLIKLDFRDWFQIEESPGCKNDFLEVRDGPHGFNSQIQKPFCGINQYYPPMITSSDRHLWVHFRSDDNIEYKGFKAVFEFIKRPANLKTPEIIPCVMNRSMLEEGELGKSDIEKHLMDFYIENDMPIDCLWTITVRPNWRIYLQFAEFNLEKPNDCHSNFVQVFSDKTDMDSNDKEFCGSIADTVLSKGNKMFVRFFSESKGPKTLFLANFTAFRDLGSGKNNECNKINEFYCEDATCIHKSLVCNEKFNCRFRWDEEDEACQGSQSMTWSGDHHIIIIMVIFSLILTGMCITFIYNCITKLIRDHQTIQEYIRQSREQQLNEIDKHVGNGDGQATDKRPSHLGDRSRSPDSSRVSVDSRHVFDADPSGSYAPEGDVLPILIRNERSTSPSNGEGYNPNIYTVDNETPPQTCDSACQTRESLFTTTGIGHVGYNSSGQSTPSRSVYAESPPAPFSTFGYKKEQSLNKFKAEAKIEMVASQRPFSAKSAPDVIVTH